MADIDGYAADPDEVKAIVNEAVDLEDLADPTLLYIRGSQIRALHTAVAAEGGRLCREAVQRLQADGMSLQAIADHLGISKPRAQQLAKHDD